MADAVGGKVGTVAASRGLVVCPHCGAPAIIRSSEWVTRTVKHMRMICTHVDCGFTWLAQIAPVHTICPSNLPDPEVDIPPCPPEYSRSRYRTTGPPEDDPNQLLMFPDDPPDEAEAA